MRSETKILIEEHRCLDLDKMVVITYKLLTQSRKTWITDFECDQQYSCPVIIASGKNPKIEACQLYGIFKRRGNI